MKRKLENYKEKYDVLAHDYKVLQSENEKTIHFQIDELNDLKSSYNKLQLSISIQKKINQYTSHIEDIHSHEIPSFVLKHVKEIFGIKYSIYFEPDIQRCNMVVRELRTPDNFILSSKKLTGIDLADYKIPMNTKLNDFAFQTQTERFNSLHEFSKGKISSSVSKMIQHLFGIAWFQALPLISENKVYGLVVLIGENAHQDLPYQELMQFSLVAAKSIQRKLHQLHMSEKKSTFKAILNILPDMIYVIDQNGYYKELYVDEKSSLDKDVNSFDEKHLSSVYSEKQYNSLVALIKECRETDEMRIFEYPLAINDDLRYFEARMMPLNTTDIFMIVRDVTQCISTERALRESLAKMNAMMENTDELVWAWSTSNKKIYTNSRFRNLVKILFDLDLNDEINLLESLPSRLKKLWLARIAAVLGKGHGVFEDEIKVNNHKRIFETSISSIILDDQIIGIAFIARDITEKKHNLNLEKELILARRTAQLKHNFLANLSHEMRTPLTGIVGMSDILQKTTLDSVQKEYLEILTQSAETMQSVIDSLIEFANIAQEKIELTRKECSLKILINNALEQIPSYGKKEIKFSAWFQDDIPPVIITDPDRFGQVINNLLSNAEKFTTKGEVIIKVYQEGTMLKIKEQKINPGLRSAVFKIEVIDTGMGLTEDEKKQLFKPFCNFENYFSRETDGTGLGLAVCKGLIHLMGGNIGVESEPGNGSTFWFTFRAEIPAD